MSIFKRKTLFCVFGAVVATSQLQELQAEELLPAPATAFFEQHCFECHSGEDPDGELNLDVTEVDWQTHEAVEFWERVFDVLHKNEMPPKKAAQPTRDERDQMTDWLRLQLTQHGRVGGTVPRRLNREEYENTIRDLFGNPQFQTGDAFPSDDTASGFDNIGEGLILSPPLMAQFLELATQVADDILPPDSGPKTAESKNYAIGASNLSTGKGEGAAHAGDLFRLASSRHMASAAGWPKRFEAPISGVYALSVDALPFQTDKMFYERREKSFQLEVYARPSADQIYAPLNEIRKLAQFEVDADRRSPQTFTCEIELFRGETFGLRWANGPAYSDPPVREFSTTFLADRLKRDRGFYAAMLEFRGGPRGITQPEYYDKVTALMTSGRLDLNDPRLNKMPKVWGGGLSNAPHNWIKAYVLEELHRVGPALDIVDVSIAGPSRLIDDDAMRERVARTQKFLGERPPGTSNQECAESVLRRFLSDAFRRPVDEVMLQQYVSLVMEHLSENRSERIEDGLHLAVRRALISPKFLYRAIRPGALDDFDLASRLSYFLTSSPPDDRLFKLAEAGKLSSPDVLRRETIRLLQDDRCVTFVGSFTGQWLSTRELQSIMPDPRLLIFINQDRDAMIAETELFFSEILRENHPIETFIDPNFSYRNANLNKIYGGNVSGTKMQRVPLEKGSRHGGVLGMASVMMATANGVDTHPVLRGVWLLENVLGTPTPEPPDSVPAIAPDTSGATTMREQLNTHRADPSCARCHNQIDPVGMALENFDPVGRWRDHYPIYTKPADGAEPLKKEFYANNGLATRKGPRVDAAGSMQDGTHLKDVTDLKRYVVENIDMFSSCLARKLLTYATGRPLTFGDRRIVEQLVSEVKNNGNGFRDLIVAVVLSESFRTK